MAYIGSYVELRKNSYLRTCLHRWLDTLGGTQCSLVWGPKYGTDGLERECKTSTSIRMLAGDARMYLPQFKEIGSHADERLLFCDRLRFIKPGDEGADTGPSNPVQSVRKQGTTTTYIA